MGDHYQVNISIGGAIGCRDAVRLAQLVKDSGAGPEWCTTFLRLEVKLILEHMKLAAEASESVDFFDDQGNYTTFEEIRTFCRKHGLAYIEHEDAYGECCECYVFWAPGMEAEALNPCSDSRPCIEVDDIKKTMAEAVATDGGKDPFVVLNALEELIKKHTLPEIPALTKKGA